MDISQTMSEAQWENVAGEVHAYVTKWARKIGTIEADEAATEYIVSLCAGGYKTLPIDKQARERYVFSSLLKRHAESRKNANLRAHGEAGFAQGHGEIVQTDRTEAEDYDSPPSTAVENPYDAIDLKVDLDRALAKVKDQSTASAIRQVYLEGYTLQEVADKQGVNVKTLHARIAAAFKDMRGFLEEYGDMFRKTA